MKGYKKALLVSLATIGTSCALLGGATFALFTSESKTNIAVTSGTVDVRAVIDENSIELFSMGNKMEGGFETGGTAEYVAETNSFNVNGMVAGDYIEFDIAIENHSTVSVKYQTSISFDGSKELFNALNFEMSDMDLVKSGYSGAYYSNWTKLEKGEAGSADLHVKMGIPESYQDKIVNGDTTASIQGKECSIIFNVTAVQGNAHTTDPVPEEEQDPNTTYIYDINELLTFAAETQEDTFDKKTVELMSDITLTEDWVPMSTATGMAFKGTFNGNGHTIGGLKATGGSYVGFFGNATYNAVIKNVNFANVTLNGQKYVGAAVGHGFGKVAIEGVNVTTAVINGNHWVGGIVGSIYGTITDSAVTGLTLNCSYVSEDNDLTGDKVGGIAGQLLDSACTVTGCTVQDSNIVGFRDIGGITGCMTTADDDMVTGNTVKNVKITIDHTAYPEDDHDMNAREVVGRFNGLSGSALAEKVASALESNTVENVTFYYAGIDLIIDGEGIFHVASAEGLKSFRDKVNAWKANGNPVPEINKNFANQKVILEADIDLGGEAWYPIGLQSSAGVSFNGIFDGQNHTISNFKIQKIGETDIENDHYGFFGSVNGDNAEIKNVTFADVTINFNCEQTYSGSKAHPHYIGVVAGRVGSSGTPKLENITVKGDIKIDSNLAFVGAVFGHLGANANNITVDANKGSYVKSTSYNVGGISGSTKAGGVVASNFTTNIDVIGNDNVGGILGQDNGGNTYTDMHATGNLTVTSTSNPWANAFASYATAEGTTVTNFTYTGKISSSGTVDGFVADYKAVKFISSKAVITLDSGSTVTYTADGEGNIT